MVGLQLDDEAEKGGAWGIYGEKRGAHRFVVEPPEGKRPLGRQSRKKSH